MKNDLDASWTKIVMALREIDQNHLAQHLEARYCAGQCLPQPPDVCTPALSVSIAHSEIAGSFTSQSSWSLDVAFSPTPTPSIGTMEQEVAVLNKVQQRIMRLEDRFVSVVTHVQCYFCSRETKSKRFIRNFRITLINLPLCSKFKHMNFLNEKKAMIKAAKDVSEIFEVLSPYWNHFDYGLLKRITMEFGDGNVKREVSAYISCLNQLEKETTIQKFVDATRDDRQIPDEFRTVLIKLDRKPSKCTLYDIRQFYESLACRSSVNAYSIYLKKIGTGSIMVTLAVPSEVVHVFVEAIQDLQYEEDAHIESLWVKGHYGPASSLSESDSTIDLWTPVALLRRPHSPPVYKPPPPNDAVALQSNLTPEFVTSSVSDEEDTLSCPPSPAVSGTWSEGEESEHLPSPLQTPPIICSPSEEISVSAQPQSPHVLIPEHILCRLDSMTTLSRESLISRLSSRPDSGYLSSFSTSVCSRESMLSRLSDSYPSLPSLTVEQRDQSDLSPQGGSEIGDMMLMAISCLMHQENCQISKCPCKEVKKRFQHLMPQTRAHRQKEAERVVDEAQRGDLDPTDRRQQLRISLSSQNFNKEIPVHHHMTSRKTIIQRRRSRAMDLTPVVEQPEEPCAMTPSATVFSPAVTPAGEKLRVLSPSTPSASTITPPVLLREISLSADNLPALYLNDCPIAATPLMQLGNRTLGSAMQSPLVTNQRRWSAGSAEGKREPVVKEKTGHQKDSPSSDEGHTTEHDRYTSQDSSSSVQTTSTHSLRQSGKSEGTSVLGESGRRTHVFDAQTSASTTSTDMDDSMRRRQLQLWGRQYDSSYGTGSDTTDGEESIPRHRPGTLPLIPAKVPAKPKNTVPLDQPQHLAQSAGSTTSHVSHNSDGSITTQTLC